MYRPYHQRDQLLPVFQLSVVLRTAGDPHQPTAALHAALAEIEPEPAAGLRFPNLFRVDRETFLAIARS
jgi:hypothetical protein